MKAAILEQGQNTLDVVTDLEVRDPRPGEVLVRIAYCGLCHSDLLVINGKPEQVPVVLGHEAAGTVEAVGAGVSAVVPGDKVVLTTLPSCGRCYWCAKGRPTVCVQNHHLTLGVPLPDGSSGLSHNGREVFRGLGVAGFSEMVLTVPNSLTKIDPDIPLDIAAVLGCAVRTGVGAVINTARVEEGDSVLVLGLGGVGQSIVMGAKLATARTVIVSDPVASRRAAALEFGADIAIDPENEDLLERVMAATDGRGVDFAFDGVGSARLMETAFNATARGGAVVAVGVARNSAFSVQIADLVLQEKRILGSLIGTSLLHRDVPRFLNLWRAGRLDLDRLITARRQIEDINSGFADMTAGIGLRTLVSF
jgi:S-(hydroxymethyl)glutathione dehydrogenase/alcohol dehydrogenase